MEIRTDLFLGDCKDELHKLADNSVDLIITSHPPMQIKEKIRMAEYILTSMSSGFSLLLNSYFVS